MKKILILFLLLALCVGCSKNKEKTNEDIGLETSTNEQSENVKERPYLVQKYIDIEKGKSLEEVKTIIEKEGIVIDDPGEYDVPKGYKKREVKIIDGKNKLELTFRDDKVSSKTFTYDDDDVNSTWFYSNYYDIIDNNPESGESFGIWVDSVKNIECSDEYEMLIEIYDNIESK